MPELEQTLIAANVIGEEQLQVIHEAALGCIDQGVLLDDEPTVRGRDSSEAIEMTTAAMLDDPPSKPVKFVGPQARAVQELAAVAALYAPEPKKRCIGKAILSQAEYAEAA